MKKLLLWVVVVSSLRSAEKPTVSKIYKAKVPPTIDGALDEECWARALPVRADYKHRQKGVLSEKPRMLARYAWDEHYLFIAYETFDRNLVAVGSGRLEGPPDNRRKGCSIWKRGVKVDVVEFFIVLDDPIFFWEIHHNAKNQFNDIWIVVPPSEWAISKADFIRHGIIFLDQQYIKDDGPYKLATAVRLKRKEEKRSGLPALLFGKQPLSTVNCSRDIDTGYTAELRIPWYGLGAPKECRTWIKKEPKKPGEKITLFPGPWKMEGRTISILAVVQDGDLAERYHHSSPAKPPGGWFHKAVQFYPKYRLVSE